MASCDSLRQIFETPLSGNPALTWNHNKSKPPLELASFTELFGELHFKESFESSSLPFLPPFSSSSPSSNPDTEKPCEHEMNKNSSFQSLFGAQKNQEKSCLKNKDGFSSMNSESLHMCTEGLGFESFDDVDDDSSKEKVDELKKHKEKMGFVKHSPCFANLYGENRRFRSFPPPIPSIGRNGKPWVSYKSFRCDGRLILKEVVNPTHGHEFMHACREDGRLTLHLVHRDGEIQQDRGKSENEKIKQDGGDVEDKEDHEKAKIDTYDIDGSS